MIAFHFLRRGRSQTLCGTLLGVIAMLALARSATAQATPEQPSAAKPTGGATISGFPQRLTPVPQKGPRSAADVASFVEGVSGNDAAFEVVTGQGRLLTLKKDLAMAGKVKPMIAVGDPAVLDFVVVGPRQIRIIGQRVGVTDVSITTADGQVYSFEAQVVYDLDVLRARLKGVFPDASVKLSQIRDHVVVEGQARDTAQITQIIDTLKSYLVSMQASQIRGNATQVAAPAPAAQPAAPGEQPREGVQPVAVAQVQPEQGLLVVPGGGQAEPRIINLLRTIGPQQVLLKVCVAELNRTSLREIGADFLGVDPANGTILGTQIGGASITAAALAAGGGIGGSGSAANSGNTTVFGIFQGADFNFMLRALRRNSVLDILAEPNLIALNGHSANFLAGGEFPIPVPQVSGAGVASTVTIQFREFGVRLGFVPHILDGDVIRLSVDPEVSSIDFALGTTLVVGGSPVPGLNTRKSHTTVELREGQTLAIAGLLQRSLDGTTARIPLLGDLPVVGPLFSSNTTQRIEKELVILVTPYLVESMSPCQVPPLPGHEVDGPCDLEFYFHGRIEGRNNIDHRATLGWDDPLHLQQKTMKMERTNIQGPCGFSN